MAGERAFERLCDALKLNWKRVEESKIEGESRPDYIVTGLDGIEFVAEVKTITPSDEEAAIHARVIEGEIFAYSLGVPGARLRGLIGKANTQVRAIANARPAALFVFNPNFLLRHHSEPYAVLTAMRGLDVVDVLVPHDPNEETQFGELRPGPKRKMTPDDNTSISAIICPAECDSGWRVDVFHNRHAARPLSLLSIEGNTVSHWRISTSHEWIPANLVDT